MAKFQKCFGKLPEDVVVLTEVVSFNSEGLADVSDAVAEVLAQVPGYTEIIDDTEVTPLSAEGEIPIPEDEAISEPPPEYSKLEVEASVDHATEIPKKPAPRRAATSKSGKE